MLLKKGIPISYIFGKIKVELIFVTVYATTIGVLDELVHMKNLTIPIAIPMILGTVLSLLLAFRSNQAYDRWWEARIIWGAIVNDSRSLVRQLLTFLETGNPKDNLNVVEKFKNKQIAWCYALGASLRGKDPTIGLEPYLTNEELSFIKQHENKPNALLQLHGKDLRHIFKLGWVNPYQQVEVDRTFTKLCDSMGKCERINNTVFPTTYSLYIHMAVFLFIGMLPFGLIEFFGLIVIPIIVGISATFLLIEKMAIHLQDPFENKPTDTPMTTIARTIERNLDQMIQSIDPKKNMPETFQFDLQKDNKAEPGFYVM